jgi:hypothetical protein
MPVPALLLAAALSVGGCASGFGGRGGVPQAEQREALLRVKNYNWSDVTIYAIRSGVQFRIGTVPSMGEQVFTLSATLTSGTSDFQLFARPLASGYGFMSEPILLSGSQAIDLTLENNINLSSYSVH